MPKHPLPTFPFKKILINRSYLKTEKQNEKLERLLKVSLGHERISKHTEIPNLETYLISNLNPSYYVEITFFMPKIKLFGYTVYEQMMIRNGTRKIIWFYKFIQNFDLLRILCFHYGFTSIIRIWILDFDASWWIALLNYFCREALHFKESQISYTKRAFQRTFHIVRNFISLVILITYPLDYKTETPRPMNRFVLRRTKQVKPPIWI